MIGLEALALEAAKEVAPPLPLAPIAAPSPALLLKN